MLAHRFALPATLALFLVAATGCGAGEGGACQIVGDCATGLVCCKNTADVNARGICRPNGAVCATTVTPDAFVTDGGDVVDAHVDVDASGVDADVDADVDAAADVDAHVDDAGTDANVDADVDAAPAEDADFDSGT